MPTFTIYLAVAKIRFISDNGYENQGFIRRYSRAIFFFMPIAGCQRYCNGNAKPLQTDCRTTAKPVHTSYLHFPDPSWPYNG